jgi:pSer/pThr/pTyr-binding forkhead associated (FHA) protein
MEQDGITFAPDIYAIIAHPSTLTRWHTEPRLVKELSEALHTAGDEAGFHFLTYPTVTPIADKDMATDETHIIASFSSESTAETRGMPTKSQAGPPVETIPQNAFLILGGKGIIPLNRQVINLGRRLDNQVVIDDPRVSRLHAQLRVAKGRFALFDLNSTGGTFVNGQRTNMAILNPGDVISLSGVTLVFGQDLPSGRRKEMVTTELRSTIPADRQTAGLLKTEIKKKKKVEKK